MTDKPLRVDAPASERGATPTSLTIGVTGHRPTRLRDADVDLLRTRVDEALTSILTSFPEAAITVLSPLAEGADQIVARAALARGCRLACALPFTRDDYARDFATASARAEYRALLTLAEHVVELDGSRTTPEERDSAYARVGVYTVDHSDSLLAIWDGQQARGNGGTGQVVDMALNAGVPVIWIPAVPPHDTRVLTQGEDGVTLESELLSVSPLVPRPRAMR